MSLRSRTTGWLIVGLASLVAAGSVGYALGRGNERVVTIRSGIVYEGGSSATASAGGVNYFLPTDVNWIDSEGAVHDGTAHPACIRPGQANRAVFATVTYPIAGATEGSVVWIRC